MTTTITNSFTSSFDPLTMGTTALHIYLQLRYPPLQFPSVSTFHGVTAYAISSVSTFDSHSPPLFLTVHLYFSWSPPLILTVHLYFSRAPPLFLTVSTFISHGLHHYFSRSPPLFLAISPLKGEDRRSPPCNSPRSLPYLLVSLFFIGLEIIYCSRR